MKLPHSHVEDIDPLNETASDTAEVIVEPANPLRTPIDELQGLARQITRGNRRVAVRFAYREPKPGTFGVSWVEIIYIWLPRMTDAVEAAIVIEISKATINWARKRMRHRSRSPKIIYLYGQDGRVIREIHVKDKITEPEIIVPSSDIRAGRTMAPLRAQVCGNLRYALILTKRFLRAAAVTIVRSPQLVSGFVRQQIRNKACQRKLQLYEQVCQTAEAYRHLRRLVIDRLGPQYESQRVKLREHVTYDSPLGAVQFETVFEDREGHASHLVHIHCATYGSRRQETLRYVQSLADFREKCKEYSRITGRGGMYVIVLVVPQKESRRCPHVDWWLFPDVQGFGLHGWVFSYDELGYTGRQAKPARREMGLSL